MKQPLSPLEQTEVRPFVFCSHAKAGSTWIDKILRSLFRKENVLRGFDPHKLTFTTPMIYSAVFLPKEELLQFRELAAMPRFVVIRDLRDTLVSYYFSVLKSHPLDAAGRIASARQSLQTLSKEDGLSSIIDSFLPRAAAIQRSWLRQREEELVFRYEDLLADDVAILSRLFIEQLQLPVDRARVEAAVIANRFENTFKRKLGETDPHSHGRQGMPGDWKNHLSPKLVHEVETRFGDVLAQGGYL